MRAILNLFCVITLIFNLFHHISSEDTLKAVQIIYRHGDRNPLNTYPTDPYDLSYWPEGWGSLTYNGKLKLYNLGRYIKQRYPNIPRKNVVAFSSDKDRTILSGMANLAGFSGRDQSILNHLERKNHTLFGLRVIPYNEDDMILVSQPCKKFNKLWDDFTTNSVAAKRYSEKYKNVFKSIYQNTGLNYTIFTMDVWILLDTLMIEKERQFKKPEYPQWANKLYSSGDLSKMHSEGFTLILHDNEIKRLRVGSMFKKFFDRMDAIIDEGNSPSNNLGLKSSDMTIVSGHDLTLSNWLIPLGIYDGKSIPCGSAIFIELHETDKSEEDEYVIKIFYKKEGDSEPLLMSIPKCPNPCNYELLKLVLAPLIVEDRQKECQLQDAIISTGSSTNRGNLQTVLKSDSDNTKIDSSSGTTVKVSMIRVGFFLIFLKLFL